MLKVEQRETGTQEPGAFVEVQKADVTDACVIVDRDGNTRSATTVHYKGREIKTEVLDLDTSKGERYVLWTEHVAEEKKPRISVHGIIEFFKHLGK